MMTLIYDLGTKFIDEKVFLTPEKKIIPVMKLKALDVLDKKIWKVVVIKRVLYLLSYLSSSI